MEPIGDFEYNKKDLIGHGAFAVVFKGRKRRKHDFVVAIKSITKKNLAKSQNLLSKEIKILKELSDLKHENVVTLFDCKETSHHVYLVMEYCNGGDLADYLQAKGTLSEDTISSFLIQIAGAMKALNAKGIVHRDLKPQNILLCHSGKHSPQPNDIKLKIADFGFARFLQDGVMAATLCGSPMYMAPEVIMSLQYDAKADLWSIGTIVFQCLTGKAPFQAQTPQQLKHFYEKNPNLMPNIPSGTSPELKDLLLKLLKRNAKDRVEFEEFFKHPFLKPVPVHPISAPVAVPKRKASFEEGSPKMKQVSSSPLSGDMPQSPPACNIQKLAEPPEPIDVSPPGVGGFMKIDKDEQSSGRSNSPSEDYVLVPEHIPSDMSGGESGGSTRSHKHPSSMDLFPESTPTSPKRKGVRVDTDNNTVIYNKKPSENAQQPLTPQQQTSPNRPSTLAVTTTPSSSPTPAASQPIPVPSQVKAYQLIQKSSSSPVSPMAPRASPTSSSSAASSQHSQRSQNVPIPRCKSSEGKVVACSAPTAGSMSPPTVQFTIGTPPAGTWMRRNSVSGTPPCGRQSATPPSNSSSPLRKSGSPTKIPSYTDLAARRGSNPFSPSAPLQLPFGTIRNMTCPANMAAIGFGNEDQPTLQHAPSEPSNLLHRVSNGDRLSEDFLLRTAFGSQAVSPPPPTTIITGFPAQLAQSPTGNNVVVPYNSPNLAWSRDRSSSQSSLSSERKSSLNRRGSIAESPPNSLPYAQSPPYMEGPIMFVAPELAEETLMDPEHNETMAKLNFILALVDCIIELAQTRSTPITESVNRNQGESFTLDHISFISEGQRRMEQLVLYVRALQLLSSSLQLSRTEIKAGRLQPSNAVKNVLKELNHHYHQCLNQCKQLHGRGPLKIPGVNPQSVAITADKLIYSYAIEMCQVAALDELFGNPQECFKRYQNAQILLHSLVHQAQNVKDRLLLAKYKASVEKRLYNLQSQGYIYAYDSS